MSYRVYEYGCRVPVAGAVEAGDQMYRRHRLWNALVEIDHRYQEVVRDVCGELKYREAKADPQKAAALDAAEQIRRVAVKQAQADSGLYWCNYDDVIAAYNAARRKPGELRFHRWRGDGKVSVRYQTGMPVAEAFSADTRLQFDQVPDEAYTHPVRAERRRLSRSVVRLRVGSERRLPVWLELPVVLHRPMPPDGSIRSAAVLRERLGTHDRWKLVVTVETGDVPGAARAAGSIGIDIGWRRLPSGLRVCAWADNRGASGEVILPNGWLDERHKVDDIRSIRDQHFNSARSALLAWLKGETVPAWMQEETATLASWRSTSRLARLTLRWRGERFDGDEAGYALAEAWRVKDRHLLEYEANLRDQLQRDRRERYRVFAAWVARTYGTVRLEAFDLRDVAEVPEDADECLPLPVRQYRTLAAVSVLRLALEQACAREGAVVEKVDSRNTTRECHACGAVERWDAAAELRHRCRACGAEWDQDENAARNLLARPALA